MRNSLHSRLRAEGGFTLIELLIVMIIMSILMAVAIPVFLGQKQKALGTAAKANATLVQKTLESCAASTIVGTFTDEVGNLVCTNAKVAEEEPGLTKQIGIGPKPGGVVRVNAPSGDLTESYVINSYPQVPPAQLMHFSLLRENTGITKSCVADGPQGGETIKRLCQPTASTPKNTTGWTW